MINYLDDPFSCGSVVTQIAQHAMQSPCIELWFIHKQQHQKTGYCFKIQQLSTSQPKDKQHATVTHLVHQMFKSVNIIHHGQGYKFQLEKDSHHQN